MSFYRGQTFLATVGPIPYNAKDTSLVRPLDVTVVRTRRRRCPPLPHTMRVVSEFPDPRFCPAYPRSRVIRKVSTISLSPSLPQLLTSIRYAEGEVV